MSSPSYSEMLDLNRELSRSLTSPIYNIAILSNSTVNLIREILEYSLRIDSINTNVKIGDYDNIVQNALKYEDSNLVILF